jgi:hypothetical protein
VSEQPADARRQLDREDTEAYVVFEDLSEVRHRTIAKTESPTFFFRENARLSFDIKRREFSSGRVIDRKRGIELTLEHDVVLGELLQELGGDSHVLLFRHTACCGPELGRERPSRRLVSEEDFETQVIEVRKADEFVGTQSAPATLDRDEGRAGNAELVSYCLLGEAAILTCAAKTVEQSRVSKVHGSHQPVNIRSTTP